MLLSLSAGPAPPTRLALKVRPVFVGLLAAQGLLAVVRLLIMDLWGAMLTLLLVIMGSFVISSGGGMDSTYLLYYGLMCLVNGIFDTLLFVERWMHVKYALFSRSAPVVYNLASAVFLLCPVVELVSTALSALIYFDAQEAASRSLLPLPRSIAEQASGGRPPGERGGAGFRPFEGRSHHL
mmetsp:Transcript_94664/g.256955  ORF Transcript_94664/g.256955 Transcript_94664/m.256955 type:complete len:181 (-) Transcript_94664:14-556(-)